MARSPDWKVYNDAGKYIGCAKHPSDAAAMCALYPNGMIRWQHRITVFTNGVDGDAADSYDHTAEVCFRNLERFRNR